MVHLLFLPLAGLAFYGAKPWALWVAGLAGSVVACLGTDSHWRWLNRLLVLEAASWLCLPLILAT